MLFRSLQSNPERRSSSRCRFSSAGCDQAGCWIDGNLVATLPQKSLLIPRCNRPTDRRSNRLNFPKKSFHTKSVYTRRSDGGTVRLDHADPLLVQHPDQAITHQRESSSHVATTLDQSRLANGCRQPTRCARSHPIAKSLSDQLRST